MEIAAYNRGTRAISAQIDQELAERRRIDYGVESPAEPLPVAPSASEPAKTPRLPMRAADKYRVQTRYDNPPVIVAHSGKLHRWIDSSAHHTLSEAKKARAAHQRVIKIAVPSEGAMLVDRGAYPGRRFNVVLEAEKIV